MPKPNKLTPAGRMAHKMNALIERLDCEAQIEGADQPEFVTLLVPPAIAELVSEYRVDALRS